MSKRVTLTDFEIEQIVSGLRVLCNETALVYEVARVGKRFYNELISKLESQHPRSVETLGVSGNGDTKSITDANNN